MHCSVYGIIYPDHFWPDIGVLKNPEKKHIKTVEIQRYFVLMFVTSFYKVSKNSVCLVYQVTANPNQEFRIYGEYILTQNCQYYPVL